MFSKTVSLCLVLVFATISVKPSYDSLLPTIIFGQTNSAKEVSKLRIIPGIQEVSLLSYEPADTLVFTGDIMLARNVEYLMGKKGCDYPFAGVNLGQLESSPVVVGNFEATVPEIHRTTPKLELNFSVEDTCLNSLSESGFTHLSLANNHSFDFGNDGFANTNKSLYSAGLTPFGVYKNPSESSVSFVETSMGTVSLIAVHALLDEFSDQDLVELFNYAQSKSVKRVVYVHWGDEYVPIHNSNQEELAEKFVAFGADLIIGHHPHVVQDIDVIDGVPVFYSLGNYIFDQYFSTDVQQGLILQINLQNDAGIELVPVTSEGSLSSPRLMTPKVKQKFLDNLSLKSSPNLSGQIKSGTIIWHSEVATSPKLAIMTK